MPATLAPSPEFATKLTAESVLYREEAFELRGGGFSNWYVDLRVGLSEGSSLDECGFYMVEHARSIELEYDVVSGMGVGGSALVSTICLRRRGHKARSSYANDKHGIDEQGAEEYGLHCDVQDQKVWVVDDTASTGNSLVTLIGMVRKEGGIVEHATAVADRSQGKVAQALRDLGVSFYALLEFSEETGQLTPT